MLPLRKNDSVVVRNYQSTSASVTLNIGMGGLQTGNSVVAVAFKIAPLNPAKVCWEKECEFMESLSHKKKKLFKKLTEKVLCDKTLMPKGFDVQGTFYNKSTQSVNLESDIIFNETSIVDGLCWDPLAPTQIKVIEDGVYKLCFVATTTTAGQFSIAVNGISINSSTQGVNKGAAQLSLRALVELKHNDILTIKNHTSAIGTIVLSEYAGGKYQSMSSMLTMFKISNLDKAHPVHVDCKVSKYYECYYHLYRDYLLYHKHLQIAGTKSFFSTSTAIPQILNVGDSIHWATKLIDNGHNIIQGNDYLTITQDGVYDIFVDIITDEPQQLTLFVNNVPDYNMTFGRDSGAARCLMRQFVPLRRHDKISIRNWESNSGKVFTSQNPGGNYPGQNSMLMAFLLTPLCEHHGQLRENCKPNKKK
jgi:hypothetical protein